MKKILIIIIIIILGYNVTGCENKVIKLNLIELESKIDALASNEFNLNGVSSSLKEKGIFDDGIEVEKSQLENIYGLKENLVEDSFVKYDKDNKEFVIILKPVKDEVNNVKEIMKKYFKHQEIEDVIELKADDYIAYIYSENSGGIVSSINDSNFPLFKDIEKVNDKDVEEIIGLNSNNYDEVLFKRSNDKDNNTLYLIIRTEIKKIKEVKVLVKKYMKKLEDDWKELDEEMYNLIKDRKEEQIGNYLVYVISNNNGKVLKFIKNQYKYVKNNS